ncbi:MAG: hypothetical protein HFJ54_00095 [Clostridia bacterium]|nr:hypothetical protein [Clostridia bacterium]
MKKNVEDKINSKFEDHKHYKLNFKWIITLFTVILILSFVYVKFIQDLTYRNIYNNITELSEQTATQLNQVIISQERFVETIVSSIESDLFDSIDEIFRRYRGDLDNYHFTRLAILDENGNGLTSDGYPVEDYEGIEDFFDINTIQLSDSRPSTVSNNTNVNVYSKTFTFKGKKMVLFATILTDHYNEILLRRLFNGEGGTYLINNDGEVLIDSFGVITEDNVSLYDFIKENHNITDNRDLENIETMKQDIKNKKVRNI